MIVGVLFEKAPSNVTNTIIHFLVRFYENKVRIPLVLAISVGEMNCCIDHLYQYQGGKGETPVLRSTGGVQAEYSGVRVEYK
jgi:hypothetical protein